MNLLSVSQAAKRLGAIPHDISDLLYRGFLRDDICPVVGRQRLIPISYLGEVERMLRRRGRQVRDPVPTPDESLSTPPQ